MNYKNVAVITQPLEEKSESCFWLANYIYVNEKITLTTLASVVKFI